MRITVIGCGYLGAVHAAAMARLGHEVVGIDIDAEKIASLSSGRVPFFEPGLPELLAEELAGGRLDFTTSMVAADVHFLAVGTPQTPSGAANVGYLLAAVERLLPVLRPGDLVVGKSTVPVGTAARLAARIESTGASLAWNPEFLREGRAIVDTLEPDRIVYGVADGDTRSVELLDEVYAALLEAGISRSVTDFATAELVKVASNAFLATKISFINAMAEIAEVSGADITDLADILGQDPRIGRRFLNAGLGFGGGCLPKDLRGFIARAEELGVGDALGFLREVDGVNLRRRERVVELVRREAGGTDGELEGVRVAILGLAFKPDSDDVRDSPALDVAANLLFDDAIVSATDPHALETARAAFPELHYHPSVSDTVRDADIVLVLTEWAEYTRLDPAAIADVVRSRTIVDARNCLDTERWVAAGWRVISLGRPTRGPARVSRRSADGERRLAG